MISTHVDDIFAAGDGSAEYKAAIAALQKSFPFGEWRSLYNGSARFCGSEIKQRRDYSIECSQEEFCAGLVTTNIKGLS